MKRRVIQKEKRYQFFVFHLVWFSSIFLNFEKNSQNIYIAVFYCRVNVIQWSRKLEALRTF